MYRDLRLCSRFSSETLEHSMTLHAEKERKKSHACAPRTRVETFSHNFRTQILLSALGVRFIYTHVHVHIFSYVSPFIEEQIRTRSNVSLESADSAFPDFHFDKRRAAEGQTRQIFKESNSIGIARCLQAQLITSLNVTLDLSIFYFTSFLYRAITTQLI